MKLTTLSLALFGSLASAQVPVVDVDFTDETPDPDIDLVVVRERAYGAGGVDLTPYGIGAGPVDFVQSIYVRLNKGLDGPQTTVRHRITFPAGVVVLGVISGEDDLGGSTDDGVLTETDLVFGIDAGLADAYSDDDRGFETNNDEIVTVVQPNVVFVMHNIADGVDDARIIVDYGTSFPPNLAFDIDLTDASVPTWRAQAFGIQIGDDLGMVAGSGDYGEVLGLQGIPMTAGAAPTPSDGFAIDPASTIYMVRSNTGSKIDAYDINQGFAIPAILRASSPTAPQGLTPGPLGFLHVVGSGPNAAYFEVVEGIDMSAPLDQDLPGQHRALTGDGGTEFLYVTRDATGTETFVDRVRVADMTVVHSFSIPAAIVPDGRGITHGNDGMLYVLGGNGSLVQLDPLTGTNTLVWTAPTAGTMMELGRDASGATLYLLRDTGSFTEIDAFDVATGTPQANVIQFAERAPRAISHGPGGYVYVPGTGGAGDRKRLWILDPATWTVVLATDCVHLPGNAEGVSPYLPYVLGTNYCGPAELNSAAQAAVMRIAGDTTPGGTLMLTAVGLPENQFGYFLVGQGTGPLFPVPNSVGRICLLGAPIGRYNAVQLLRNSGSIGRFSIDADTSSIPLSPPVAVMTGETWNFQCWYRDVGPTSNFTDAIGVTFH